jgi:hypothetical protein
MKEKDEPSPSNPYLLGYWHSTVNARSPVILAFAFIGGFAVSAIVMFIFGVGCVLSTLDPGPHEDERYFPLVLFGSLLGCLLVSINWFFKFRSAQRKLPLDLRRQPSRYFQLGLLIGLGVAALLEGICFGAASS